MTREKVETKLSDSLDARRLHPCQPRVWRWRLAAAFAALVASLDVLLPLVGTPALIDRQPAVGMLHIGPTTGGVLLTLGLLSLCLGVFFWRFNHRRSRHNSDLSLLPNLMKKRD